jgi:hypothetical protein
VHVELQRLDVGVRGRRLAPHAAIVGQVIVRERRYGTCVEAGMGCLD